MTASRVRAQTTAAAASELTLPGVDLLIAAPTWDIRCLAIGQLSPSEDPTHVLMLDFADRGRTGRVDEHDLELTRLLAAHCASPLRRIPIDSKDLVAAWIATKSAVLSVYNLVRRPLRVAIDLNSVPRYIALSLLGFGARTGTIATFVATYAAAASYSGGAAVATFTEGSWIPRSIPTLGEGAAPSSRSLLVIAAGFEGSNTLRLANALEPDRIALAISTGIRVEHEQSARRSNVPLAEEFMLGDEGLIWLPADDVAGSVALLGEAVRSIKRSSSADTAVSFVLCGTKIGALAVALYAIDEAVAQVYYSDPERRLESSALEIEWVTVVEIDL